MACCGFKGLYSAQEARLWPSVSRAVKNFIFAPQQGQMYRERLKLKTGCKTCRIRRKKCDEARPRCEKCARLDLVCTYPESQTRQRQPISTPVNEHPAATIRSEVEPLDTPSEGIASRLSVVPAISSGYPLFRNEHESTLFHEASFAIAHFTTPIAGKVSRDLSAVMTIMTSLPWARDSFTAFGGMMANRHSELDNVSTMLYGSAIYNIRQKLSCPEFNGDIVPLIVSITFLGISEGLFVGNAKGAIDHFFGVLELLKHYKVKASSLPNPSTLAALRVVAECLIYNVAIHAISYRDLDRLPKIFPSIGFEKYFASAKELAFEASPLLAGLRNIYYLTYEVSVLGRHAAQMSRTISYRARIPNLSQRINEVDRKIDSLFTDVPNSTLRRGYTTLARLHIASLRILLGKADDLTICGTASKIRTTLRHALELMEAFDFGRHGEITMCVPIYWPLVIFSCAASERADILMIEAAIDNVKHIMTSGHRASIEKIQTKVHAVRIHSPMRCPLKQIADVTQRFGNDVDHSVECNAQHDALSLLVHPKGLS